MPPVRCAMMLAQPARLEGDTRAVGADLLTLLAHVPGWAAAPGAAVDAADVALTQLGGAMSNHIFRVQSTRAGAPPLLLRLYGSLDDAEEAPSGSGSGSGAAAGAQTPSAAPARLFSRDGEVRCAEAVAALGLGPPCFVLFANGRLEEYLDGSPLFAPEMRTKRAAAAVAAAMARFHAAATPALGAPCALFARLRAWLAAARAAADAQPAGAVRDTWRQRLAGMPAQLDALEARLAPWAASGAPGAGTVFSHNDLQHNNILRMHTRKAGAEDAVMDVALIDYEYALSAPAAYDIGNHFCEWAADYAESPLDGAGMLAYALRYPSKAQREAFCAAYLAALPAASSAKAGGSSSASAAEDAAALAAAADTHALASHLLWGFWGVIQERASSVDFDFLGYSAARFDEAIAHAARLEAEAR